MNLHKLIAHVQRSKNLQASDIYQGASSKQMYQKFIHGLKHVPEQVFLKYLEHLHLTTEELLQMAEGYDSHNLYYELVEAKLEHNNMKIMKLKEVCQSLKKTQNNDVFQHLEDMIDIWQENFQAEMSLIKYLSNVRQWSSYEIRLLSAIILFLPFDLAKELYHRAKAQIYGYGKRHQQKKELIWLDLYYLITCLKNKELEQFEKYLREVKRKSFSEYLLSERIMYLLIEDIYLIMKNPDSIEGHELLKQDFTLLKRLDCNRLTSGTLKLLVNLISPQSAEAKKQINELFPF